MSTVLSLLGYENPLRAYYFPPLELHGALEVGLLSLHTRNVVPNVTFNNNIFYYDNKESLVLPPDYYTLHHLSQWINTRLMGEHKEKYEKLTDSQRKLLGYALINITWNPTLNRVEMICAFPLPANSDRSLIRALGFETELSPFRKNIAEFEMRFYSDNLVRINCDGIRGCYHNSERSHTIYEFDCNSAPGERYVEKPNKVTYFPVCDGSSLREVAIELCDQHNNSLNLRGELTLVRLHLRNANRI